MNAKWGGLLLVAACTLMVVLPIQAAVGQTPTGTIVVPESTINSGNTLVVNVTIKNVQNLWGLDATITWDIHTMQLVKVSDWLGAETYPGGVLHETPSYPIAVAANETSQESGSHHIAAISQGDAAPFYGSGTIATLTFTVTATQSTINVTSELADYPEPGETTSEPIPHTDLGLFVETMPTTSPTINPSTTPQPTPTPTPEFPQAALVVSVLAAATIISIGFILIRRKASKPASASP
jgi:hypothetical protein